MTWSRLMIHFIVITRVVAPTCVSEMTISEYWVKSGSKKTCQSMILKCVDEQSYKCCYQKRVSTRFTKMCFLQKSATSKPSYGGKYILLTYIDVWRHWNKNDVIRKWRCQHWPKILPSSDVQRNSLSIDTRHIVPLSGGHSSAKNGLWLPD